MCLPNKYLIQYICTDLEYGRLIKAYTVFSISSFTDQATLVNLSESSCTPSWGRFLSINVFLLFIKGKKPLTIFFMEISWTFRDFSGKKLRGIFVKKFGYPGGNVVGCSRGHVNYSSGDIVGSSYRNVDYPCGNFVNYSGGNFIGCSRGNFMDYFSQIFVRFSCENVGYPGGYFVDYSGENTVEYSGGNFAGCSSRNFIGRACGNVEYLGGNFVDYSDENVKGYSGVNVMGFHVEMTRINQIEISWDVNAGMWIILVKRS